MSAEAAVGDRLRVDPDGGAILPGIATDGTPCVGDRKAAEGALPQLAERLHALQEGLFVEGTRSVLVVLQAMDTGGKDGTIEHVFGTMNPAGVGVAAFKKPTDEELAHHFLWRIERRLPGPGQIMIFNRSHYEDVLVARVHSLVPEDVWSGRYDEINAFEAKVAAAGTTIVKCFLDISYDEQRARLVARLDDPDKRWKFNEGDIDERARWADYQAAYEDALQRCGTDIAPWYVIPADRKWYRNWAVSSLLAETLEEMAPRHPRPVLDIERLKARLAPPH
jgi:PPK2 family polyphosphate:nucleotide phosphotransferase